MGEQCTPNFLRQRAKNGLTRLQELKSNAEQNLIKSDLPRAKRELLTGVLQDVNDNCRILEAWIKEFEKANRTNNSNLLNGISLLFGSLFDSIAEAEEALNSRWRRQLFYKSGFGSPFAVDFVI